jgi:hypothetical protein
VFLDFRERIIKLFIISTESLERRHFLGIEYAPKVTLQKKRENAGDIATFVGNSYYNNFF